MIAAVVTAAFFAGFGMGMIYGYLRVWRKLPLEGKVPSQLPTCVKCGTAILGNDYRVRGVQIGDPPSEDGLAYEHFPECPS